MIHYYEIKEHEVPLFPLRYAMSIFNCSRPGILQKERRGHLPGANFRNENGHRLYSIEDLGIIDYIYKEIWPYKQGIKVPNWVGELASDALAQSKAVVINLGMSDTGDNWSLIHNKYSRFNKDRAQLYVDSWRRRLLEEEKFFQELVNEEE